MKKAVMLLFILLLTVLVSAAETKEFYVLNVEGVIDAANSDYITKNIAKAEKNGAAGVILEIDTPGGLMKSMRKIIDGILASSVPVITFVSPMGARAASAGTFILLASHVAAMAEGTNIGTASPIDLQGNKAGEKITNDSIAFIKNLARVNGRNETWAEKTITENISSSEIEALKEKAVDLVAEDIDDLMIKIDGRKITIGKEKTVLSTKNYFLKRVEPSVKHKFLHYLADPNISYILFMVGIYGIIYELANPGALFPGIAGAISLVLAFIGFDSIPINIAGIILIVLAVALFLAEAMTASFGVLFAGGSISLLIGSLILFPGREAGDMWAPSYVLIGVVVAVTMIFFALIIWLVIKAQRKRRVIGKELTIGHKGTAVTDIYESGVVNVGGEEWKAFSEEKIKARDIIEVVAEDGMKLKVKKVPRKKEEG